MIPSAPATASASGPSVPAAPPVPVHPVTASAPSRAPARTAGVRALARVRAVPDGRGGTALPLAAGEGPLALRRTRSTGTEARLTLVGAMSAPLGGDALAVHARAEDGARLRIDGSAATIALPGRTGEPATYDVRLTVGEEACAAWLPEPFISAAGSHLRQTTRIDLAPSARLVFRDEQILGRAGETTGRLTTRLVVRRAGRALLDQQLDYGPGAPGWDGPAVLGGHRAVGQLLLVDPEFEHAPPEPRVLGPTAAVTRLAGPAVLVSAIAPDGLQLRRLLDGAGTFTSW